MKLIWFFTRTLGARYEILHVRDVRDWGLDLEAKVADWFADHSSADGKD